MKIEKSKQEIIKIDVKTKNKLNELYKSSALTFTGVSAEDKNLNKIIDWLKERTEIANPISIHIIKRQVMNEKYKLTGRVAYPKDRTLISIKLEDIYDVNAIAISRFDVFGRWFSDIVDNNARSQKQQLREEKECSKEELSKFYYKDKNFREEEEEFE